MHSYMHGCVCVRAWMHVCVCVCVLLYGKVTEDKGVPICMHIELWPSVHSDEPNYIAQVTKGKQKEDYKLSYLIPSKLRNFPLT